MSDQLSVEVLDSSGSYPLRIEARLRNGVLDDLIVQFGGVKTLARELGISAHTLSAWVNLRTFPTFTSGKAKGGLGKQRARRVAVKLCELSGKRIEDIFPGFSREAFGGGPRRVKIDRPLSEQQAREAIARRDAQSRLSGGDPVRGAASAELKSAISEAVKTLTYREREVIKLRYGLGDGYSYDLGEVGRIFKVTRERVRQIEAKAIRKLQQPSRSKELIGHVCTEGQK